ncbi:hypothetical protein [Candidatus Palauibacter soopunensis]|uniref:hypothetical protein n=1 Tax=Candidatus Palauibacter soopunensis TaxID=3056739 RepID=UPI002394B00A|nr:hypothetical protein [Candidatus Palauibacter soopunensis]MDE2879926.1 hypothetical protein [Candidatus Palauibacter soopunensis]
MDGGDRPEELFVDDWNEAIFQGWRYLRNNPHQGKVHVRYRGAEHGGVTEVVRASCNGSDFVEAATLAPAIVTGGGLGGRMGDGLDWTEED